jgi:AsmA protein
MPASDSIRESDSSVSEPDAADPTTRRSHHRGLRRLIAALIFLLVVLLMAFVPPLLNLNRFQRRIERNIAAALGRPVHFDRVSLTLLPLPGFTLDNFVVAEDPAFGAEPIITAASVDATVRFSSLWRRRVEFSTIALTEPTSINLVHTADGRWNIQGLLLQASQIQAAPTAQKYAGPAPRFPYIEATGARLNLKLDRNGLQEKTPFSLTDADFALWLPEPHQWQLRLKAHPVRTDAAPADTGTVSVEGSLGSISGPSASLDQLPINLSGEWRDVQLGGLSHLLLGRDADLRGELALSGNVVGTVSHSAVSVNIKLTGARRAAFVPANLLNLEAACNATAEQAFHAFSAIDCRWPPAGSSDPGLIAVTGDLPDARDLRSAYATFTLPAVPTATLLDWLSLVTARPPTGVLPLGSLTGSLSYHAQPQSTSPAKTHSAERRPPQPPQPNWSGEFVLTGVSLKMSGLGSRPIKLDDITLRSSPTPPSSFDLLPVTLPLDGRLPAQLEAHFDASGYTLHLTGTAIPARLLALGDAIPQLGDGLQQVLEPTADADAATPIHLDLTATRPWGGTQTWVAAVPAPKRRHRYGSR